MRSAEILGHPSGPGVVCQVPGQIRRGLGARSTMLFWGWAGTGLNGAQAVKDGKLGLARTGSDGIGRDRRDGTIAREKFPGGTRGQPRAPAATLSGRNGLQEYCRTGRTAGVTAEQGDPDGPLRRMASHMPVPSARLRTRLYGQQNDAPST